METMYKVALEVRDCRLALEGLKTYRSCIEALAQAALRYGLDPAGVHAELLLVDTTLATLCRLEPLSGLDEVLANQQQYERLIAALMLAAQRSLEARGQFAAEFGCPPAELLEQFDRQRERIARLVEHFPADCRSRAAELLRRWGLLAKN